MARLERTEAWSKVLVTSKVGFGCVCESVRGPRPFLAGPSLKFLHVHRLGRKFIIPHTHDHAQNFGETCACNLVTYVGTRGLGMPRLTISAKELINTVHRGLGWEPHDLGAKFLNILSGLAQQR